MLKTLWQKIHSYKREEKGESLRQASKKLGIPKSTLHYQEQRLLQRSESLETDYWNTAEGQNFLKRMIISVIYTFGIKGGVGCERLSEHFKHLGLERVAAVSPSSIGRLVQEIEQSILKYKNLQESNLHSEMLAQGTYLQAILGVDETWLEDLLLICQELSSGYFFLRK